MSSGKRRNTYLDSDGNINCSAKYRVNKKIISQEETAKQISQDSTCRQDEESIENVSVLSETEALIEITPCDNDLQRQYEMSSDDEEFHVSHAYCNDSKHLHDLLQIPGFCDTITTSVEKSPAEILFLILKYSISNKLPLMTTVNLIQLVNSIFATPVTPDSRYMIDKLFNSKDNAEFHATCSNCDMYIGKFGSLNINEKCANCHKIIDVSNPSAGNYFAIMDPSHAISEYLHAYEDHYSYVMRQRRYERGHIKDIYDGKCYRDFVENLPELERQRYVTTTFNTDGAPVFESSTYSIWPIYLMINELPVSDRLKNLVVCGLWFGKSKPQMSIFVDCFVDKINENSSSGIPCTIKGESLNIKLYALICSVDTVARSPMNGTMQFNAYCGCDWCLHPGEWYEGCVRYPVLDSICEDRDMKTTLELMKAAVEKGLPIFGVKNASPLINLYYFDIIRGFVPDYLHCFLAGVAKQLTESIIQRISSKDFKTIEFRLSKIKAPHKLGRLSRPLKDRAMWKAREWENWLLYYSIPVLDSVIDNDLFKHWSLIVESLHTLLKDDIKSEELDEVDQKLHEFVCGVEQLYSKAAMTYNIHQLLHIAKSVYDWGPLWAHSTFPFESGNHELLTAIHCAKGVKQQILRYLNMQRSVNILEQHLYPNSLNVMKRYWNNFNSPRTKKCLQICGINYFGSANIISEQLLNMFHLQSNTRTFRRIVKNGCLYASSEKKNLRSCNSFAQLINKTYVKIVTFVVDVETDNQLAICNAIETTPSEFSKSIQTVRKIHNKVIAARTTDIDRVCVFLDVTDKSYISSVPNLLKY